MTEPTVPPTPAPSLTPPHSGPADPTAPAAREELLAALNELLEAERAGARVALESTREAPAADLALVQDIHKDEVRWCGMLMRTINAMDATPSATTGAFHGKAMAIADLDERLLFLNRGQAWVVRRLQALIPRVEDARVKGDLAEMLAAHLHNIERVDVRAAALSRARTAE